MAENKKKKQERQAADGGSREAKKGSVKRQWRKRRAAGGKALSIQERSSRRRRVRFGSYSMALTAVVVAGAVVLNLAAAEIPSQYTQVDLSGQKLTVLSDQTKELVAGLSEDITLYYMVQDSSRDSNISRLLKRYEDLSEHITVEEKDPVLYPKFTSQYTEEVVSDNSVIAVCGDQSRVISYDEMYEAEFNYTYYTYETTGFDGEGQITSAIASLCTEDRPVVYTLTGHNEITLSDTMLHAVEKDNMQMESLNLVTSERVPEDADCVLIVSPASDLSEAEAKKLLNYLRTGGKAVIVTDYTGTEMENLNSVLEYYGTSLEEGVVIERDSSHYVQMPYYLVPEIGSTEVSEELTGGNVYVLLAAAQGIRTAEELRDGLSVTGVLSSSSSSYSKVDVQNMTTYEKESGDIDGPFDLGVLITETVELTDELLEETSQPAADGTLDILDTGMVEALEDGTSGAVTEDEKGGQDAASGEASANPETGDEKGSEDAVSGEASANPETGEEKGSQDAASGEESADPETGEEKGSQNADAEEASGIAETEDSSDSETEADTETAASAKEDTAGGSAKKAETAETRIAVFTSSALLDDSADQMVSGGNSRLFMNTLSWICGQSTSVSVPVKSLSVNYLTVTSSAGSFWSIVTIGLIPGVFLLGGLCIWIRRRRQ